MVWAATDSGFSGQRVVILGLARQGIALAHYLVDQGAEVVVSDLRRRNELADALDQLSGLPVETVLGGHPTTVLDAADLVCLSAGVPADTPVVLEALARGIALSNDSQIFLAACPATVVGITGSAGKTTTTALTGEMCRAGGRRTWVGGNIGRPLLLDIDMIEAGDLVIMELSSFQLEIMTRSVAVGAILNLTPNHLDRHKTMDAYTAAKARLLSNQSPREVALLGQDDPGAWALRSLVRGRIRAFSALEPVAEGAYLRDGMIVVRGSAAEQEVCLASKVKLRGSHNVLNVLAAAALADAVGVPVEAIAEVSRSFAGVEHRLELVREHKGIRWYDDSIATAPERMMAAVRSFTEPLVLLAGGRDKKLPWKQAASLVGERVRDVVLFGEAAELIQSHLAQCKPDNGSSRAWHLERVVQVEDLEQAVEVAASLARPGDVVLLSPGGTSFDAYQDFEMRGDHFKELVRRL